MGRLVDRAVRDAGLTEVRARVLRGEPGPVDVDSLLGADLLALGAVADAVRSARHGDRTRIGREVARGAEVVVRAGESASGRITAHLGSHFETVVVRPDPEAPATGEEILRVAAACRIALDADHVSVPWETVGFELAQVALAFGVDELLGPVADPSPLRARGSERGIPRAELENLVRKAEREPAFAAKDTP